MITGSKRHQPRAALASGAPVALIRMKLATVAIRSRAIRFISHPLRWPPLGEFMRKRFTASMDVLARTGYGYRVPFSRRYDGPHWLKTFSRQSRPHLPHPPASVTRARGWE